MGESKFKICKYDESLKEYIVSVIIESVEVFDDFICYLFCVKIMI